MVTIACDTDFIIKISNDPIPKFDLSTLSKENEFLVIPEVFREIIGLERSSTPSTSRRAQMAHRVIVESAVFRTVQHDKSSSTVDTDNALIEFVKASPNTRAVATMDGSLLSRLEKIGLPYLTLSKGRTLLRFRQRARYLTAGKV